MVNFMEKFSEPKIYWGQIAYDGYCTHTNYKSLATGQNLPQWKDLAPVIQEAWEAAADSVIVAHTPVTYKLLK